MNSHNADLNSQKMLEKKAEGGRCMHFPFAVSPIRFKLCFFQILNKVNILWLASINND